MNLALLDLKNQIIGAHEAAAGALNAAVEHAVRAGQLLLDAKAATPHGEFGAFCATLPFAETTARGYMRLARLDPAKRQRVADLPLREALLQIAAPREAAPPPAQPRAAADYFAGHPFKTDPTVRMFGSRTFPPGHSGSVSGDLFVVEPSQIPGYFFVSKIESFSGDRGAVVDTFRRPIAYYAVGWALHSMGLLDPRSVDWEEYTTDPAIRPFFDVAVPAEQIGGVR